MKWTEELTLTEVLEKKEAATQSPQSVTAKKKINLLLV